MHSNDTAHAERGLHDSQPPVTQCKPTTTRAPAFDRFPQLGARARSFRAADLSDGGDRAGGGLPAALCRADRAVDRGFRRLRRVLAAGRLARRPLEPPQHDGGVLYRLRRLADRRRGGAQSGRARRRPVRARRVRRDLSSGRHADAAGSLQGAGAHGRVQRRVRQSGRRARRRHRRRDRLLARLARGISGAGARLHRHRHRLCHAGAGRPPPHREPQERPPTWCSRSARR